MSHSIFITLWAQGAAVPCQPLVVGVVQQLQGVLYAGGLWVKGGDMGSIGGCQQGEVPEEQMTAGGMSWGGTKRRCCGRNPMRLLLLVLLLLLLMMMALVMMMVDSLIRQPVCKRTAWP
jgi:hypothetical protein